GENITVVAQYIVNASTDIGFSNMSYTQSGPMAGKGHYIQLDSSLYGPLPQGAVILRYGLDNNPTESKAFYQFLYGEEARQVLRKNGYGLP
ncbi:MAG TPA: substrate-binding domain-containing protein, partial [Fibrobacteraceae bacterium]|nr:substrate-binding domain-containing protein [Fibrobacteraceae bacterium]